MRDGDGLLLIVDGVEDLDVVAVLPDAFPRLVIDDVRVGVKLAAARRSRVFPQAEQDQGDLAASAAIGNEQVLQDLFGRRDDTRFIHDSGTSENVEVGDGLPKITGRLGEGTAELYCTYRIL